MLLAIYGSCIWLAGQPINWSDVIRQKLDSWWIDSFRMVPNVMLAILFWLAFYIIARLFRRFGTQVTRRFSKSKAVGGLVSDLIYIALIVAGFYVALNILKLDKIAVSLLAGAGIIGLTLAFAFQDLTSNFISGVYIDFNKPFDIGDVIETNGVVGEVEDIGLRSTILMTMEGTHLMIPNKAVFQSILINHSRTRTRLVRIDFEMTISDAMEKIGALLTEAVRQVPGVDRSSAPEFFFTDIDANNLKISVLFRVVSPSQAELMKIKHLAILVVLKTFSDNGIKRLG